MTNWALPSVLAMGKQDIIERACSTADHQGRESWLWMPTKKCKSRHICLVAHVDTVFDGDFYGDFYGHAPRGNKKIYHDTKKQVYWSPEGLGADDRAGVYAVMELRRQTGCMVLLTDHEECGGGGAREAAEIFRSYFKKVVFFLEIDRKERGEMVFYNGESPAFKAFIGGFGFREKPGSFSDISILSRETGIVGVNLSAGYYNQHTRAEYLIEKDLHYTMQAAVKIIQEGGGAHGRSEWKIAEAICPEFGRHYDSRDVFVRSYRRREGAKVVGSREI